MLYYLLLININIIITVYITSFIIIVNINNKTDIFIFL